MKQHVSAYLEAIISLSACTVQLYLYSPYGQYGLYKASVPVQYSYTSTPPMRRTACTEPQCLYKGAVYPTFMCHMSLVLKVLLQNSFNCHKVLLFLFCAETLEREMERVQTAASQMCSHHVPGLMPQLQAKGVVQAVKAVCALMGNVETQYITEAVESFKSVCLQFIPAPLPVIISFSVLSLVVLMCVGRDSSVGIATCYGLNGPGIESR
jgi:hypothetical protein